MSVFYLRDNLRLGKSNNERAGSVLQLLALKELLNFDFGFSRRALRSILKRAFRQEGLTPTEPAILKAPLIALSDAMQKLTPCSAVGPALGEEKSFENTCIELAGTQCFEIENSPNASYLSLDHTHKANLYDVNFLGSNDEMHPDETSYLSLSDISTTGTRSKRTC